MRIFRICPGSLIPSVCLNFIYQTRIRLVSACEDDPSLAMQYAMDTGFLRLNGAQVQLPSYHVEGQVFRLADSPASTGPDSSMVLRIDNPYPLPLRVHAVLKSKLQLSQKRLDQLTQSGRIQCEDGRELKKSRTGNHIRLYITGVLIP